jgi:hypothetical protein
MPLLALLGDSVFDNGSYTNGGPAVVQQVNARLPEGWSARLLAVDGSTTDDIAEQLARVPDEATHLVLSVGGNNALLRADLLQAQVASSAEALLMLGEAAAEFEQAYRRKVDACLALKRPLVVCTVYHGNFPDPGFAACAAVALTAFNDAIIRVAAVHGLTVIDLRTICTTPDDYANPIEPSAHGGDKIASAIVRTVAQAAPDPHLQGARVLSFR